MVKYILLCGMVCCMLGLQAQVNLVPNPSFEQYISCPNNTSQVDSCVGWHGVLESPDYYNTCAPYPVSIPDNFCGYQNNFDGNAYMGLLTYVWYTFGREIFGVTLLDTLIVGNTYNISMRVSRGNWTNQSYNCSASNKLGIRFTTNQISTYTNSDINNYASVYTANIITDTLNWVLLEWNFVADSAYTHMYIGNFFDDSHTDTAVISAPIGQFGYAYYFIDSVNVFCTNGNCNVGLPDISLYEESIFYIQKSNKLDVHFKNTNYLYLSIINVNGNICLEEILKQPTQILLPELAQGIYFAVLQSANKTVTKKFIIY
ncbi:MAG: T9SS type A sorting domain-containing protein [Bacteroidetes bacterium]|nr:T9SS type A sorting domain-containing protein [Bacteroidota bacterium]